MKKMTSFTYLNITQFLGALNDNLFKILIVFLLINIQGTKDANIILSTVGFLFVLPFLLFSQLAGTLADKFSKKKIAVATKWLEVIIAFIGIFAFLFQLPLLAYIMLFMMALQSNFFSPAKYGIVPELVPEGQVVKANGHLASFTYIAMIVGTFLASFLTDVTDKHLTLASLCCLIIAIIGLGSSYMIQSTPKAGSKKKASLFFLKDVYRTLKFCKTQPYLLTAVLSSAYFLFIGAFVQLNIIPFAIQALGLGETKGGYLFLICAVGISIGAAIAGKVHKVGKFTMSFVGAVGLTIFSLSLTLFSSFLWAVLINLGALGAFGGLFIVPMDSFMQIGSPPERRGQVIGTNVFLSFMGVLFASFLMRILAPFGEHSAVLGFFIISCLNLVMTLVLLRTDIEDVLHRYAKFSARTLYRSSYIRPRKEDVGIYIAPTYSRKNMMLALASIKDPHPCLKFSRGVHFFTRIMGLSIKRSPEYLKSLLDSGVSLIFFADQTDQEIIDQLNWPVVKHITFEGKSLTITNEG